MKDKSKRQKKRYAHPSLTEQSKEGEKQKNHQSKFIPEYLMTFMKNAPVFVTKYLSVEWKTKVSSYIYMLYVWVYSVFSQRGIIHNVEPERPWAAGLGWVAGGCWAIPLHTPTWGWLTPRMGLCIGELETNLLEVWSFTITEEAPQIGHYDKWVYVAITWLA